MGDETVVPSPLTARAPLEDERASLAIEEVTDLALVTIALPSDAVRARLGTAFGVALPAVGESIVTDRGERLLGLQVDRLYILFEHPGDEPSAPASPSPADPERALLARLGESEHDAARKAHGDDTASANTDDVADERGGGGPDATATDDSRDTVRDASDAGPRTLLYSSDQSDAWAMLRLVGRGSRAVLERLCPLDLHPDAFALGALARSVVEHLGVIVLREGEDTFLLLSPRSSAGAFLHEIRTASTHLGSAH